MGLIQLVVDSISEYALLLQQLVNLQLGFCHNRAL